MSDTKLPTVLVVEDSPDDLLFIQRAAVRTNLQMSLKSVTSGDEAISYLLGEGSYGDRNIYPLPSVVLTDTRMPRISGLELVTWIRQQDDFKDLPIVVMSSSTDTDNAKRFAAFGISLYFVKPMSIRGFEEILREVMLLIPQNQE
ncbi:response regulator [Scytonema sp. UIC 10036]|uniref:response regulator n=1 Tax=Scytonema sp. UIC 10036 TaxID=2304196 RepID=UPI00140F5C75|nr:response regulator [Scytonema sp. UIC 10036]